MISKRMLLQVILSGKAFMVMITVCFVSLILFYTPSSVSPLAFVRATEHTMEMMDIILAAYLPGMEGVTDDQDFYVTQTDVYTIVDKIANKKK